MTSVSPLAVTRLDLTGFRCYPRLRLTVDRRPVVLTGPNGAGKTNILEALSLLVPGGGLRRARLAEIGRQDARGIDPPADWAVAAHIDTPDGPVRLGTGIEPQAGGQRRDKRRVQIDGVAQRGQAALGRVASAVWLTPQMDRLFQEGPAARRRFLDRLVNGLDPEHAGRLAAFEKCLRQRARLLKEGRADPQWLAALEDGMARHGIAVAAARVDLLARLVAAGAQAQGRFPAARLALSGGPEAWLAEGPALDAEDRLRAALAAGRRRDAALGGAAAGPQRSDLAVWHAASGRAAAACSTGEQKALLIAVIIANARLQAQLRGAAPLVLLDEVVAHLDPRRRADLFEEILALGVQAWMTGTDESLFAPLGARAQFFRVAAATLTPSGGAAAQEGG